MTREELVKAWAPNQWLVNRTYEQGKPTPYTFDLPAQSSPYSLALYWGGRSLSDTGAKGGAYLYLRELDDPNAQNVQIGYEATKREFPDDDNEKEHWVVDGVIANQVFSAGKNYRITCTWAVTNEHCVNVHLRIRFRSYV